MKGYRAYIDSLAQSPNDFYRDNMQARMDSSIWENTTRLKTIKHENYPFDYNFENMVDVISNVISETYVGFSKILGDYKQLIFKDVNYNIKRGQYLKYPEDNREDIYLVYEGTQELDTTAKVKALKCNNKINWYDDKGVIQSYPCTITTELSGTQIKTDNLENTTQGRLVCLIQSNSHTNKIKQNMRFPISNTQVFKVNNIDVSRLTDINIGERDLLKLYIQFVPQLDSDDMDNNISKNYLQNDNNSSEIIIPTFNNVAQYMEQEFKVGQENDVVTYSTNWADNNIYKISRIGNNFKLECLEPSKNDLEITFNINGVNESLMIKLIPFI